MSGSGQGGSHLGGSGGGWVPPDRTVILRCDHGADGLFGTDGRAIQPEHLPIPDDLRQAILDWQAAWDAEQAAAATPTLIDALRADGPSATHAMRQAALARDLRDALPGWTVLVE